MKKKVIILVIIVIVLAILLIPIPTKLRDGGSTEYRALLYSVTKYHELVPTSENEEEQYLDGTSVKILGMEVFNNKEEVSVENNENVVDNTGNLTNENIVGNENNTEITENTSNNKIVVTHDGITNISTLDNFIDNADRYNENPISSEIEIVRYTVEGDETLTTLKYDKDNSVLTLIEDYTKDKYGSQEIVTNTFLKGEFDLIKTIRDEYIDVDLIVNTENSNETEDGMCSYPKVGDIENEKEIRICSYPKDFEKNKDTEREKISETLSKNDEYDINKLVKYNGTLYAKSNALIDYAGNPDGPIGIINKLIGEEYVPTLDGETNSEELLNAKVSEANEEIMVLYYNNAYVLFQVVNL